MFIVSLCFINVSFSNSTIIHFRMNVLSHRVFWEIISNIFRLLKLYNVFFRPIFSESKKFARAFCVDKLKIQMINSQITSIQLHIYHKYFWLSYGISIFRVVNIEGRMILPIALNTNIQIYIVLKSSSKCSLRSHCAI